MPRQRTQSDWSYDGSINRWPMRPGELWSCGTGKVMVRDLYDGLPAFMLDADCVFVDPPYNRAVENSYRTKAGLEKRDGELLSLLFACIGAIDPKVCYVEMGKGHTDDVLRAMTSRFRHVDLYPSTYYRKQPCFVVRGGKLPPVRDYSLMDELEIIDRICAAEPFNVIADLCMGRGAVGIAAYKHGREFRGTELNPARLAVMVNRIADMGGEWTHERLAQPG